MRECESKEVAPFVLEQRSYDFQSDISGWKPELQTIGVTFG
ncbi:MAG: hypothetical protein PHO37_08775 [Kiritimatiellae bacterium]|nr:hypothetical protein [Kiritimatiellia bacterium]